MSNSSFDTVTSYEASFYIKITAKFKLFCIKHNIQATLHLSKLLIIKCELEKTYNNIELRIKEFKLSNNDIVQINKELKMREFMDYVYDDKINIEFLLPEINKTLRKLDEIGITCNICFDNADTDTRKLNCGHIYHKMCIQLWLNSHNTCPMCRRVVS